MKAVLGLSSRSLSLPTRIQLGVLSGFVEFLGCWGFCHVFNDFHHRKNRRNLNLSR